jgi:ectoine hydroxylase-related dioxygenase (phytanoyl-CoA dioxygenase family)
MGHPGGPFGRAFLTRNCLYTFRISNLRGQTGNGWWLYIVLAFTELSLIVYFLPIDRIWVDAPTGQQRDHWRNIAKELIGSWDKYGGCTARGKLMTQDLSVLHHPVHSLFLPTAQHAAAEYALGKEQIEFFHQYGYLTGVRILSDEQVEVLRNELARLLDPTVEERELFYEYNSNESGDPNHVLFHALGAWRIAPGFHDLLWHPAFTIPAAQLLGGAVRFWHDQLFCKPAHHGGVVAWHQDYSYWTRTQPLAHLTCWIGLDDSTRENGCLQYIAGSHRWPDLPITGLAGDMDAISAVLDHQQRREFERPVAVELKKGEASFHHPRLVHGSFANHSDRSRRATVINVMKDGVRSGSNEPLLHGVPVIPPGQKVEGQFFPLLSEE